MAAYENVREVSVIVGVDADGVAAVDKYRFAKWSDAAGAVDQEVIAASGVADIPAGIISQRVAKKLNPGTAYKSPAVSMAVLDQGIQLVELGEAVVDLDVPLRCGTDGKAFLADAAGDRKIAKPLEVGAVGQIIRIQGFGGAGELVPA
jgi:hypothetical protein